MRSRVERTLIRLNLGKAHCDKTLCGLMLDDAVEEVGRDNRRGPVEERALHHTTRHPEDIAHAS
jgi:hypothetical protein